MFGIVPTLILAKLVHSSERATLRWTNSTYSAVAFVLLLLCYFLLQLNFDLISHNFGARFFYFFNSNLLFVVGLSLEALALLTLLSFSTRWGVSLRLLASRFTSTAHLTYHSRTYPTAIAATVLTLWLVYSFFDFIEASRSLILSFIVIIDRLEFRDLNTTLVIVLWVLFSRG